MARSEAVNEEIIHIGRRIRALRKLQGLTLKRLAERTGLSVPYLSQIENGRVDLNITNLQAISRSLGCPLVSFFVRDNSHGVSLTRRPERRWYGLSQHIFEALLVRSLSNLEVFIMRLLPQAASTADNSHPGEEFTYVVRGSVRVVLQNQHIYDLDEGDLIYYLSDLPHRWQNITDKEAEVLVVNTPATY
jgi:transcriptional regulator with XRE-family HTH domain